MPQTFMEARRVWWLPLTLLAYWLATIWLLGPQWSLFPQYNYGWAVPALCAYLLWLRWSDRPQAETGKAAGPGSLLIGALIIWLPTRVIVEANPLWRVGSWAMGVEFLTVALTLLHLVGGKAWLRHFWFPFAFYLVAIPWPSQWEGALVQGLTRMNTALVVEGLAVFGIPAIQHGNVIEINRGLVGMEEACSGIRSLQATLMIALFFGELYRLRAGRRVALLVCGVAVALLCNLVRTFTLVWISSRHGNAEMERWHDATGVAILLGCFISLWLLATRIREEPTAPRVASESPRIPAQPGWLAAALCGWLVAVEGMNAGWFAVRDHARAGALNWSVRWPVESPGFREVTLSPKVLGQLAFDEGQSVAWTGRAGRPWQAFHFRWGPARNHFDRVRVMNAKSHRPEVCLPASGQKLVQDRGSIAFPVAGLRLPFRSYQFEDRGTPVHVYFCAWEDGPEGGASFLRENIASRIAAARAGSRGITQRVLEVAVWGSLTSAEADAEFQLTLNEIIRKQTGGKP